MKRPHRVLVALLAGASLAGGLPSLSAQVTETNRNWHPVIVPPAINDRSSWSRAPFPAARQFDDVKAPDGQAIDDLPPNTPATSTQLPPPPPRVAILQSSPPAAAVAEPALAPTGRITTTLAASLDATNVTPSIRSAAPSARDAIIADIESRLVATETALASMRGGTAQLGADARRQFDAASEDAKARAKTLRQTLDNARRATPQQWESLRARLASEYEAYSAALARIDAALGR